MKLKLINLKFRMQDGTFVEASPVQSVKWPGGFEVTGATGPLKAQDQVDAALAIVSRVVAAMDADAKKAGKKPAKKKARA